LLDLHKQYGPVVRVGPNEISISDWKQYRSLYNNPLALKEVDFYSPFILGKGSLFQMTYDISAPEIKPNTDNPPEIPINTLRVGNQVTPATPFGISTP